LNRRVLVIEPDGNVRDMIELALSAAGFAPVSASTVESARGLLDGNAIEVAVVELRATNAEGVEGVRSLRSDHPTLPLVVMGTLLTPRVLQELIRIRVDDVVPKPFTPRELVDAVTRVLRDSAARGDGAVEYAAAMAAARRAITDGHPEDAEAPLARARAASPLDAESMALTALARELVGADDDAARAYRASLALEAPRVADDALPLEGLARIDAYGGARVVPEIDRHSGLCLWLVADAHDELRLGPPAGSRPDVVVFALGLAPGENGATYARVRTDRSFLIASGTMNERLALRIGRSFDQSRIVAHSPTLARLDPARTPPTPQERQ
jgi:DNA-binding response OmpR family regulator